MFTLRFRVKIAASMLQCSFGALTRTFERPEFTSALSYPLACFAGFTACHEVWILALMLCIQILPVEQRHSTMGSEDGQIGTRVSDRPMLQ